MTNIYYKIKPLIPRRLQLSIRRFLIKQKRNKYTHIWPIIESSSSKPKKWNGWPERKKFAVVLTHDVELQRGFDRCQMLMKIEKQLGFKSSYNFVPERYKVSPTILKAIQAEGFEVGVHGLNHDGKLYSSKNEFDRRAIKINQYVEQWEAVGFRSPAMHHNLEWIKKLNIQYDASTFDTDPFEPQSDGVNTIFPFSVKGKSPKESYIELPYTIAQDFTLFILMKEKTINLWKKKIDWIAQNGGMLLVNTHPDYMDFVNKGNHPEEYPIDYYTELLTFIKTRYKNQYWHALPKDLATFWNNRNEKNAPFGNNEKQHLTVENAFNEL
jgi:peptidoglycan/xylan/chitin deacetylase (PgdA/CDA1 family)